MTDPYYTQRNFRGRNDDGSETGASWIEVLNIDFSQDVDVNFRIRFSVRELNNKVQNNVTLNLQYNLNDTGWNNVTTTSSVVRAFSSIYFAQGDDTTQQIDNGTFITDNNGMSETGVTDLYNHPASGETECEFCVQIRGDDVNHNNIIQLRVIMGTTILDSYLNIPTITVIKSFEQFIFPNSISSVENFGTIKILGENPSKDIILIETEQHETNPPTYYFFETPPEFTVDDLVIVYVTDGVYTGSIIPDVGYVFLNQIFPGSQARIFIIGAEGIDIISEGGFGFTLTDPGNIRIVVVWLRVSDFVDIGFNNNSFVAPSVYGEDLVLRFYQTNYSVGTGNVDLHFLLGDDYYNPPCNDEVQFWGKYTGSGQCGPAELKLTYYPPQIQCFSTTLTFYQIDSGLVISLSNKGISSNEAFGNCIVSVGEVLIIPSGIISDEAFGNHTVSLESATQFVYLSGILSSEAFGNTQIIIEEIIILPQGIISSEIVNNPQLNIAIYLSGVPPEEQFGNLVIGAFNTIVVNSIESSELFGNTVVTILATIQLVSIDTVEIFGNLLVVAGLVSISPAGIESTESLGNCQLLLGGISIIAVGIISNEILGNLSVLIEDIFIYPSGIQSLELIGEQIIVPGIIFVQPASVDSQETVGNHEILPGLIIIQVAETQSQEDIGSVNVLLGTITVSLSSIESSESFGNCQLSVGALFISLVGISSSEQFGDFILIPGGIFIQVNGIQSQETFGNVSIILGSVSIIPNAIVSQENFGNTAIYTETHIYLVGTTSDEEFGNCLLIPGDVIIVIPGISSLETFGNPIISTGEIFIVGIGISSSEIFGSHQLMSSEIIISVFSIDSNELFGNHLVKSVAYIIVAGIEASEQFGNSTLLAGNVFIKPVGLVSSELFGSLLLTLGFPPQYARPSADISIGGWTNQDNGTENLYQSINDPEPIDETYVQSSLSPQNDVLTVALSKLIDPYVDNDHVVRVRLRKNSIGGPRIDLTVDLLDGIVVISTFVQEDVGGVEFVTVELPIPEAEAANIVNYDNLYYRFTANEVGA